MTWTLSDRIDLRNERIPDEDGDRQMATAGELLRRLAEQPGVVLADEVGMGKTFVALAVAASVVEATNFKRPVVVMVPAAVADKWPREWDVFQSMCLKRGGPTIRATTDSIRQPSEFLKLLDDPPSRRKHIIFLTHGALTNAMNDPLVQLAIVRHAMKGRPSLAKQRRVFPWWASRLIGGATTRSLRDNELVEQLMETDPSRWIEVLRERWPDDYTDDPVPHVLLRALSKVDMSSLRAALATMPLRDSRYIEDRLREVRSEIRKVMGGVWGQCLRALRLRLPLLILDEAHHAKNPTTRFASLFTSPEARADADALEKKGPLGNVFDKMLFMTATPFQLGHRELLQVMQHFDAIRWDDPLKRTDFAESMKRLEKALDGAQAAAALLELAWGRVQLTDFGDIDPAAWATDGDNEAHPRLEQVAAHIRAAEERIKTAEAELRPWIIRHARPDKDARRNVLEGARIADSASTGGLQVTGSAVLPFLLAARAQAVVSMEGLYRDEAIRAHFAEGLASSFEAYRETRQREASEVVDTDGSDGETGPLPQEIQWYLDSIDQSMPSQDVAAFRAHPKISATVERALALWEAGEKVVVFCFYIATGRALRSHISRAMNDVLVSKGAAKLGLAAEDHEAVRRELDRFGNTFFDEDRPVTRRTREVLDELTLDCEFDDETKKNVIDVMLRFLRTPSFLVRHVDLSAADQVDAMMRAFEAEDASGVRLREKFARLARFIAERVPTERIELLDALSSIQTGEIFAVGAQQFDPSERSSNREALLPNVRLANGGVDPQTRRRLMLAFNTPLFPEVLIASSVMAEGVDLHLNCRHVIHHDLDWNPSVLEQRTGRVDRLGSKSETSGKPIVVYQPYVESTQDEKQFLVVKDRERWFNVVMGEKMSLDEHATDRAMERVPLPEPICRRLTMQLGLGPHQRVTTNS
jgi:superfamily II DNA or RNA helicase